MNFHDRLRDKRLAILILFVENRSKLRTELTSDREVILIFSALSFGQIALQYCH